MYPSIQCSYRLKGCLIFSYLTNLWTYLESFVERALPLYDYPTFFAKLEEEFEALWNEKGADFRWSTAEEDEEVKRFESETKSARTSDLDSIDGLDDAPPAALVKEVSSFPPSLFSSYLSVLTFPLRKKMQRRPNGINIHRQRNWNLLGWKG